MKRKPSTLQILAAGAAWRLLGIRGSGETLLAAVAGGDEQSRMLAGMSLVRAGRRSFDLIEGKLRAGQVAPPVLRLLPDIDQPRARAVMQQIIEKGPADLRAAAGESLELLDRIEASESGDK